MTLSTHFRTVLRMLHDRGREVTPDELQAWLDERFTACSHEIILGSIAMYDDPPRRSLFDKFNVNEVQA
jgi:hypothetical protein